MTRWIVTGFAGVLLLAQGVAAQTPTTQTTTQTTRASSTTGAFDQLSLGNQKIARALYDAQPGPASGTADSTPRTAWTLDEIAAHKQSGQGWGNVFKEMKAQGLLQEKTLGQVVSRASRHHGGPGVPSGTLITTASGRTHVVGGTGRWEHSAARVRGAADEGRPEHRSDRERADLGPRDGSTGRAPALGRSYGRGGEGTAQGSLGATGHGGANGGFARGGGSSHGNGRGK